MRGIIKTLIISCMLISCVTIPSFGQNVVSIVNSANTLKITYDDASISITSKRGAKITNPPTGTVITLTDINMKTYIIDFNLITSPIAVNKNALALVLSNYLN